MKTVHRASAATGTLLLVFALVAPLASGATAVGLWDRFEASVQNTKSYGDPYRDVTLNVTYTRPGGGTVSFWGFYDGGTTWKLRFMPDRTGTWSYSASFSDGRPGASGTFDCVASDLPGLIGKNETNPMWFGYRGGHRLLLRSFHVGDRFFAANWDDPANPGDGEKRKAFLDWAQGKGYNMLSIASHFLNRETSGRGLGWDTPDLWDGPSRSLKAAEYGKLERILDDLAARKLIVWGFAGFFGQSADFPTDRADQELYVRYTLARLGPYGNLLFNVAGPEPLLVPAKFQNAMAAADIDRLGTLVRDLDVFGHLVTCHNKTGNDAFKDKAWSGYGTLQGPKTTSRSTLSAGLLANHHASKPLYAHETLWEGNQNHPSYSATDIRKNAYVITLSAATLNFADNSGDSSSGFSGSLDPSDANSGVSYDGHAIIKKVWDFFETVPFHSMSPRQDLVSAGYCLAKPGERYLVYLESRGTVNVAVTGGPYAVEWINAQNTADRRTGGTTADGQGLTTPAAGDDWLLSLTAGRTSKHVLDVDGARILLNGREIKVIGLRCSNALVSDANTDQLIGHLDTFKSYGVNTVSVFFMGSRFGDVKGYNPDATLNPTCAGRMARIIEAADDRGMIVLVGCLYWSTSTANDDLGGWTQADANRAIANTVRWLKDHDYRNVFVDVDNEGMAHDATGWSIAQMIDAGHAVDPDCLLAYNDSDPAPANADLCIHHSPKVTGKPWLQSEGTPTNAPGGYWGSYSKLDGYYNYIRIGRYTADMKTNQISQTNGDIDSRNGHMLASTWLQCAPSEGIGGPFMTPGGLADNPSIDADVKVVQPEAGILWWLNHVKSRYGPWIPPGSGAGSGPAVTGFTLVNADTDLDIGPLADGATINLAQTGHHLSVRAEVSGTVESVRFGLDGNANTRTENSPPYALAGDGNEGTDYYPWSPSLGAHTLAATPYPLDNAGGTAGAALAVAFTVIDQTAPAPPAAPSGLAATAVSTSRIDLSWTDNAGDETGFAIERKTGASGTYVHAATVGANATAFSDALLAAGTTYNYRVQATNAAGNSSWSNEAGATTPAPPAGPVVVDLILIDADTDLDIGPLVDGATLDLSALPTRNLSIRAETSPATVGSVLFGYDGNPTYQLENNPPYAFAGNTGSDYGAWTPAVGAHALTATPYTDAGATGTAGTAMIVHFTVADGGGTLPAPWLTRDVGSVGLEGGAEHAGGTFTLEGSGADIWGTADAFRFVHRMLDGDGEIRARVASVENTNAWAKAGVMMRETLEPGSRHAMLVVTPARGASFQRRKATGATSLSTTHAGVAAPAWVRLVRQGDSFSGYRSADGTAWTWVGTETIAMGSTVHVGLPVTAHDNTVLCTAQIDGVTVETATVPPAPLVEIASVSTGKPYSLGTARRDALPYIDRSYVVTAISAGLDGGTLVRTAMDDKYVTATSHLTLRLGREADVFVCYDARGGTPAWIDGSWTLSGETVVSTDVPASPMRVFAKTVPAGDLALGGNHAGGDTGARANYVVVVHPSGAAKALAAAGPIVEGPVPAGCWSHELDVDGDGALEPDGEGDGMIDVFEPGYALDPAKVDTDADGAPDESAVLADGRTAWEAQMGALGVDPTGGSTDSALPAGGGSGGGCWTRAGGFAFHPLLLVALLTAVAFALARRP